MRNDDIFAHRLMNDEEKVVNVGAQIRVKNPTDAFMSYCRMYLEVDNPEYIKKQRMGKYLGKTPMRVKLYERDGDELVLPYGCLTDILPIANREKYHVVKRFTPKQWRFCYEPNNMGLFDYQEKAVHAMVQAKGGILQAPAGSGKTQCGIGIIQKMGCRALWITHTKDLLEQSLERAKKYIDERVLGTITEGEVNIGYAVTFATVQTMARMNLELYKNDWDLIIVDECHRVAGTPTAMTMFSKVLNSLSARYKYGLSATVHRADGMIKATYALLGKVAHTVPDWAVGDRVMQVKVKPRVTYVKYSPDCLNFDGTLNYARMVTYLGGELSRNTLIVHDLCLNFSHSCLILSDRLEHLKTLMDMLPDNMKEKAVMVSGKMTSKRGKEERTKAIEQMRTGEKLYLFATYALAKEGLDIPRLSRLFLTTPQKDEAIIIQSIGRIARKHESKDNAVAYDYVDNEKYLVNAYKQRVRTYKKRGCVIDDSSVPKKQI